VLRGQFWFVRRGVTRAAPTNIVVQISSTAEITEVMLAAPLWNASQHDLTPCVLRFRMKRVLALPGLLGATVLVLLILPACNALNPACGSSRPVPNISSLSDSTVNFSDVQTGFTLTINGNNFVAATVGVVNGLSLPTQLLSSTQLQITIDTSVVAAPGTADVTVNTPAGNSGYVGCSSGGTSSALVLTIN
jgi:hypothetical protein